MPSSPRSAVFASLVYGAAGAVLAGITCGGIVEQRLSSGSLLVAVVANAFVTFGALLVLGLVQRRDTRSWSFVPQAIGAALGILGVHVALRVGLVHAAPWMSERPPQLVNDAVAVFSTLALVWACARGLRLRLLLGALAALTLYRATASLWHLDASPRAFVVPVQDFVVAQFVAAALALLVYRGVDRQQV